MSDLNDQMSFGRVIEVTANGDTRDRKDVFAEESVLQQVDGDGQAIGEPAAPAGWTFLEGFSGQHGYRGPVMHSSESIGGGLETHIRQTPGLYVALTVECSDDGEPAGWVIAHRDGN